MVTDTFLAELEATTERYEGRKEKRAQTARVSPPFTRIRSGADRTPNVRTSEG
jgi:hypothetical protein